MTFKLLKKSEFILFIFIFLIQFSSNLRAEVGLSLPELMHETERGLKFDEFVFKPTISVETRYDSNYFRSNEKENPQSATYLSVMPGFKIVNPNPNSIQLNFGGFADIRNYFSSNPAIKDQSKLAGEGNLDVVFFPKGKYQLKINGGFQRTLQGASFATGANYNLNLYKGGGGINIVPGGGALKFSMDYNFQYYQYPDFEFGDTIYHNFRFYSDWKFYPKTSVFVESTFSMTDYLQQTKVTNEYTVENINARPFRAFIGLDGYISKKIVLNLKAGYGNSMHEKDSSFNNVIGEASIGFKPIPAFVIILGGRRDYAPSYYASFYTVHEGFAHLDLQLFQRLNLRTSATYSLVTYSPFTPDNPDITVSQNERKDQVLRSGVTLNFNVFRYLSVTTGYSLEKNMSDFSTYGFNVTDYASYTKHEVFGGISLLY
jgi:hypothetical protein